MARDTGQRRIPGMRWERAAWRSGRCVVAGVDEVGRGAWAGPIVAAAVVIPLESAPRARIARRLRDLSIEVRDSKLMLAAHREMVVDVLVRNHVPFSVASLESWDIDVMGLTQANARVMCDAVHRLTPQPDHVLVDAFTLPDVPCSQNAIVRGDSISLAIALASIVAKVHRDARMVELCSTYPGYAFSEHKGYGTLQHRDALHAHGPTMHHRRSFRPVARLIEDVSVGR